MQVDIIEAVVLGAVQGITEFLPVSSHAHLILVPWLFGWPDPGLTFDVALHLGTLAALLAYFHTDWIHLGKSTIRLFEGRRENADMRLARYIIIGTIPAAIAGLLLEDYGDSLGTPKVIGAMLILVAVLMRASEMWGQRQYDLTVMNRVDVLTIGLAQAVAIIPGVSRSGVTIAAGLFRGLTRKAAAQFSFLLSAPIVAGAVAKKLFDIASDGLPPGQVMPFVVGILVSALFGYFSIAGLMRYLQTRTTFVFINYRMVLGIGVLTLAYYSQLK